MDVEKNIIFPKTLLKYERGYDVELLMFLKQYKIITIIYGKLNIRSSGLQGKVFTQTKSSIFHSTLKSIS